MLRDNELIIPHGATQFEVGDRVTVVGAAADYAGIVDTFTSGESRFPLNFGRKVAVVLDSSDDLDVTVSEALSLVRNSQADELMVLHRDLAVERDVSRAEQVEHLLEKLEAKAEGVAVDARPGPRFVAGCAGAPVGGRERRRRCRSCADRPADAGPFASDEGHQHGSSVRCPGSLEPWSAPVFEHPRTGTPHGLR